MPKNQYLSPKGKQQKSAQKAYQPINTVVQTSRAARTPATASKDPKTSSSSTARKSECKLTQAAQAIGSQKSPVEDQELAQIQSTVADAIQTRDLIDKCAE